MVRRRTSQLDNNNNNNNNNGNKQGTAKNGTPTPQQPAQNTHFPDAFPRPQTGKEQNEANAQAPQHGRRRRRRGNTRTAGQEFRASDDIISVPEAEELLGMVQGHLIQWPYEWLEREEQGGNWLYTLDQISPLEIYD
ncbi:Phospholipase D1 [Ascosphaera atra]|nr:Phospholipase D1 [Ascosphaera atra]